MQGIELIRDMLNKFFAKYDVKAIDAWGEPFDPGLHEAFGVVRHPKLSPNTVARVERKGYLYRDKLLRPAQVVVRQNIGVPPQADQVSAKRPAELDA